MTNLTDEQRERVQELGETYHEALQSYRKNLDVRDKAEVRDLWTSYASLMGLEKNESEIAALGALLPFAALLETLPAEEVRQGMILAILSHLDELL